MRSPTATRVVILVGLGVLALGLSGFIWGAIGAAFFGTEALLPKPEVHLPAQSVLGDDAGNDLKYLKADTSFVLTNTLLSSFVATAILLIVFVLGTARLSLVPGRFQSVLETIVEGLLGFIEGVIGPQRARQLLPVIATIFLFVAVNAWLGLLPIYQSFGVLNDEGHLKAAFLRPAGTDLNMPLALALVSFVFVEALGIRTFGLRYFGKFIRLGNLLRGRIFTGLIDLFVGLLEAVSELVRVVSFTFRLFGNMLAGEILLLVSAFLVAFVFTVPFYGLELLVGFVQALIFAGLTLVFASVALTPHEEEH